MTPAPNLFRVARAMFREIWDGRLADAAQTAASVKAEVKRLEKQTDQFLSRIVETQNEAVIAAYEKRIAQLEQEKLVLLERASKAGAPQRGFEEMFELSMRFLASPWNIWEFGQIEMRRMVLRLAFAERLGYVRNQGFRTPLLSSPFNMLSACEGGKSGMARPAGFEPATPRLGIWCSILLSYGRNTWWKPLRNLVPAPYTTSPGRSEAAAFPRLCLPSLAISAGGFSWSRSPGPAPPGSPAPAPNGRRPERSRTRRPATRGRGHRRWRSDRPCRSGPGQ
jgi:hypothetical protein